MARETRGQVSDVIVSPISTPQQAGRRSRRRALVRAIALGTLVALGLAILALGLLALAIYHQSRQDETAEADAIVVLGTAQFDGQPSATFRARLEHARSLYEAGYAPLIVLTGGAADGDWISEAEAGRNFLIEQGVPSGALLAVPAGRSSSESLRHAAPVLRQHGVSRILLVSDPFHMFRVKRIAADLGFAPLASPTRTSPIRPDTELEYRYMARELGAYLAYVFTDR
ncbi:MAG: YdcF family protein [Sphaerobacter sp.]|nr:YdcF family protein [Sphaerobacter sp.]